MSVELAAIGAFAILGGVVTTLVAIARAPARGRLLLASTGVLSTSAGAGLVYGSVVA